jgi:hypothetical protein
VVSTASRHDLYLTTPRQAERATNARFPILAPPLAPVAKGLLARDSGVQHESTATRSDSGARADTPRNVNSAVTSRNPGDLHQCHLFCIQMQTLNHTVGPFVPKVASGISVHVRLALGFGGRCAVVPLRLPESARVVTPWYTQRLWCPNRRRDCSGQSSSGCLLGTQVWPCIRSRAWVLHRASGDDTPPWMRGQPG